MKVEITRNADNKVVGYKLIKESDADYETIERIRDMYYWGLNDQVIVYNGRSSTPGTDYTCELRFCTEEHKRIEKEKFMSQFKYEDDLYDEDPYRDQRESEDFYGTDH